MHLVTSKICNEAIIQCLRDLKLFSLQEFGKAGCRKGGSVIDWVMMAESVSFPHAFQILREMPEALIVTKNIYENPPPVCRCERLLKNPFEADMNDHELMKEVVTFYHECLKKTPDAFHPIFLLPHRNDEKQQSKS
jgi:hypothetical protein